MAKLKRPPRKSTRNAHARAHPVPRRARKPAAPQFQSLQEIVLAARRNLSPDLWNHLSGGSDSETTLRRNRYALDCLALRQRVLVNVVNIDISTTLLGKRLALPVFMAPVGGFVGFVNPRQGAIPVARAAIARGTTAFISTAALPGLEETAAAASEPLIFHLYVRSDHQWIKDILDRAKAAGYRALCVTVDRNYYGRRERDIINRAAVRDGFGDPKFQASLCWNDLIWMKERMQLPLIIKGIATAEDARMAVEHGADVVYVSNHGGRQLDHGRGAMQILPEIVAAVAGRAGIMVDGSFCRGTDIVKAIAAGADLVGIGRLQCWALAAAGEEGIVRMLELLEDEVIRCLGLLGVPNFAGLDQSYLHAAAPTAPSDVFSAFPLLDVEPYRY